MTSNITLLSSFTPAKFLSLVHLANGNHMTISHVGTMDVPTINLPNTYHVSNLSFNLTSVGQLGDLA